MPREILVMKGAPIPCHHGFTFPSIRYGEGWFLRSISWADLAGEENRKNRRLCHILRTSLGKTEVKGRGREYRNEFACTRLLVKKQVSVAVDGRCQRILCPQSPTWPENCVVRCNFPRLEKLYWSLVSLSDRGLGDVPPRPFGLSGSALPRSGNSFLLSSPFLSLRR